MVIIDTTIWVEFLKNRRPFSKRISTLLEENQVYALECIFAELMQGALNNRERDIIYEYWLNLPKPVVKNIFLKAGIESGKNKWTSKGIGLIDSVIILTARESFSEIWTLDKKLKSMLKSDEIFAH
ncbi:MAG: PIN domain-containing protein [Candidatus Anammoxibacter sp.]